jgi:hypothetical protein
MPLGVWHARSYMEHAALQVPQQLPPEQAPSAALVAAGAVLSSAADTAAQERVDLQQRVDQALLVSSWPAGPVQTHVIGNPSNNEKGEGFFVLRCRRRRSRARRPPGHKLPTWRGSWQLQPRHRRS